MMKNARTRTYQLWGINIRLTESRPCVGSGDGRDDDETKAFVFSTTDLNVVWLDGAGHHAAVAS